MRILSIGCDESLFAPAEENEAQYRQRRYCEALDQEKLFVVMHSGAEKPERVLAGGRLRVLSAAGESPAARAWRAWRRAAKVGRDFHPDVIEYQDPQLAGWAAWRAAASLRCPLIGGLFNDCVDNPHWVAVRPSRRFFNRVSRFILYRSLLVRCDSAETVARLAGLGFMNLRHVPFFVSGLERFVVPPAGREERLRRWENQPTVLGVARLAAQKNLPLLLRAFAEAGERGRLVIAGEGQERAALQRLSAGLGLADRVRWEGHVAYDRLPDLFRAADLFALSSDHETSARALLLARVAGLPTVTTATSGSRDFVSDEVDGFVTPIGEETAFAARLRALLNDRDLYQKMLAQDAAPLLARHGESAVLERLQEYYREAMTMIGERP